MLKHENIHIQQYGKKKVPEAGEFMGNISNKKEYFSNKDEVMAFSQSISDMIMDQNPKDINDAIRKLKFNPLYKDIQKSVDIEILQRYKKYIYLYLEKEFEK